MSHVFYCCLIIIFKTLQGSMFSSPNFILHEKSARSIVPWVLFHAFPLCTSALSLRSFQDSKCIWIAAIFTRLPSRSHMPSLFKSIQLIFILSCKTIQILWSSKKKRSPLTSTYWPLICPFLAANSIGRGNSNVFPQRTRLKGNSDLLGLIDD